MKGDYYKLKTAETERRPDGKRMSRKNDILDAWIMVEHLSEGDINLKDKTLITFGELQNENYYRLFLNEMRKRKIENYKKALLYILMHSRLKKWLIF